MADETKEGTEPTVSVETATAVLKAAGLHVLPQSAFAKIREEAASKAALEATQAKAELDRVNAEYQKAAERLKAIDDKGKSSDDLWRERQAEWQRQLEAERKAVATEKEARIAQEKAVRNLFRDNAIQALLAPNATSPEAAQAAHLLALQRFPTLSTDASGRLTYVDPAGIEHTGDEAAKVITDWWGSQKWAHRAPAPGPATHGGGTAPPPAEGPVYPPGATQHERIVIAARWEEARRTGQK